MRAGCGSTGLFCLPILVCPGGHGISCAARREARHLWFQVPGAVAASSITQWRSGRCCRAQSSSCSSHTAPAVLGLFLAARTCLSLGPAALIGGGFGTRRRTSVVVPDASSQAKRSAAHAPGRRLAGGAWVRITLISRHSDVWPSPRRYTARASKRSRSAISELPRLADCDGRPAWFAIPVVSRENI
ncbi:hypothetical protein P280DRAFT_117239 [Massarina eburnea CBS 473.64]|uniref:Uncharacterized protein n=1 Tax=Massarina eburnea CBS 473.64 TaxID=1395130 RepID=A0A6A6SGF0_9PLEO|nr:hypothetical protein P280DRAFT_117239 [Massarina eburnea CBS 473.64]